MGDEQFDSILANGQSVGSAAQSRVPEPLHLDPKSPPAVEVPGYRVAAEVAKWREGYAVICEEMPRRQRLDAFTAC